MSPMVLRHMGISSRRLPVCCVLGTRKGTRPLFSASEQPNAARDCVKSRFFKNAI